MIEGAGLWGKQVSMLERSITARTNFVSLGTKDGVRQVGEQGFGDEGGARGTVGLSSLRPPCIFVRCAGAEG